MDNAAREKLGREVDGWQAFHNPEKPISNISPEPLNDDIDTLRPPPRIDKKAFHLVEGKGAEPQFITDIVQLACDDSEASPEGVAFNVVVLFSALIGREKIKYPWSNSTIDARPSVLVVGESGSNKGISEHLPVHVFDEYKERMKHKADFKPLRVMRGGLNSGEGLTNQLRDETEPGEGDGTDDKRALIIEAEFAKVLSVCRREGSTLSGTLRNFHDGIGEQNTSISNPSKCTNPHLVMMAHITKDELLKKIKDVDISNGFINRFMILHTIRDKDVPSPKPANKLAVKAVVDELVEIMDFVNQGQTMTESACFSAEFNRVYTDLNNPKGTKIRQSLLARTPKYTRMLSMIFALMERQSIITANHLETALLYIRYWWESVSYIFEDDNQVLEYQKTRDLSEKVLDAIVKIHNESGKCTKTDISNAFSRKLPSKDINDALSILLGSIKPKIIQETGERTNGGRAPKYYIPAKLAKLAK